MAGMLLACDIVDKRSASVLGSILLKTSIFTTYCDGLQELGLNEVFSGGLSSYSVVNMVMAQLSAEGMALANQMAPGAASLPEICYTAGSPDPVQQNVAWRLQQILGEL